MSTLINAIRTALSAVPLSDASSLNEAIRMLDERAAGRSQTSVAGVPRVSGSGPGRRSDQPGASLAQQEAGAFP